MSTAFLTVSSPLADADVGATQQVRVRDESPEVGRHTIRFRNYGEKDLCRQLWDKGRWCGYRVTKGRIKTKLTTYRLVERRPAYDYYLVDVDMVVKRRGSSKWGWAHASLATRKGVKQLDRTETRTINATQSECRSLDLSLSTPWPVVSGSADLGSVRFCEKSAHFKRIVRSQRTTEYKANRVGRTHHLSIQRWVKVPRGAKPRFKVRVRVPIDRCTKYRYNSAYEMNLCIEYDNARHAKTFYVHSRLRD